MDKFTINDYGQAVYINEKVRIPKHDEHDTLSDISDSPISSSAASFFYPPSIVVTHPIPTHLSSRDLIPEVQPLTDVYFDHVHKYVPMIHKPTFLKQMHNSSDPPSRLLLYAMCAVASKWSPDHIAATTNDEIPPGYTYYRKALDLLDDFVDSPRISTIQALILIVKYQEYIQRTGYHHRSYFYLGMAAQMCFDLGLTQLEGDSSIEIEIKKRTFWVTFTYDLLLSIEQGHKPYFDVHSCTTGFPLVTGEEGPALEELITNQNIFIQLCKVLSDIYTMSRRIALRQQAQGDSRNNDQIIEEQARLFSLHTHLENFLFEIPPSLVYPPTQDTDNYPVEKQQAMSDPFIGFLHMTYHFSVILLHCRYAQRPLPETEFGFVAYPHRRLCAVSASNITGIVETMFDIFPNYTFNYPARGVQHTVHCLAIAAHIHKYEMENGSDENVRVSARLQYMLTVDMMQTLAGQSPSAEFCKYRRRQMKTAEKRMSAPVYQFLPQQQQPIDMYVQQALPQPSAKPKNRRNTFSSPMSDPALYQSSASITDSTQLASILSQQQPQQQGYQPYIWPYHQQVPMPSYHQEKQQKIYCPPLQQPMQYQTNEFMMIQNDNNDKKQQQHDYDMLQSSNMNMMMMPEDGMIMDTAHQYDPTPGMSQLFLTDNAQISWPTTTVSDTTIQRSEGHVMK